MVPGSTANNMPSSSPQWVVSRCALLVLLLAGPGFCSARSSSRQIITRSSSTIAAAAIPWFGGKQDVTPEEPQQNQQQHSLLQQQQYPQPPRRRVLPPPPPPKPPPPRPPGFNHSSVGDVNDEETSRDREDPSGESWNCNYPMQQQQQQPWGSYQPPPPPPPGFDQWQAEQQFMAQQQQQWEQGQQSQQMGQYPDQQDEGEQLVHILQAELEESNARESELYQEIQNLTLTVDNLEQTITMNLKQVDVFRERVIDAESHAAAESNAAREQEANCTSLQTQVNELEQQLLQYQSQLDDQTQSHEQTRTEMAQIQATLKARQADLEELACLVENSRMEQERTEYMEERRRKQKKRGFFGWLFGIGTSQDEMDMHQERMRDLSRSTLLHALQSERNNVDELEAVLMVLQQNNSAISDMVKSRDDLINELNDRVAVFEEDKIVLKAALRQLQKEMKEEAPKTQKLVTDLDSSKAEIQKLQREVELLLTEHNNEAEALRMEMEEKDVEMKEITSKMSMIGTYVDQLEERLAAFAIARRDITVREKECKDLETQDEQLRCQLTELEMNRDELTSERGELKGLLQEMIQERETLRRDMQKLRSERDGLLFEGRQLREEIESLAADVMRLNGEAQQWKKQFVEAESELQELVQRQMMERQQLEERHAVDLQDQEQRSKLKLEEQGQNIEIEVKRKKDRFDMELKKMEQRFNTVLEEQVHRHQAELEEQAHRHQAELGTQMQQHHSDLKEQHERVLREQAEKEEEEESEYDEEEEESECVKGEVEKQVSTSVVFEGGDQQGEHSLIEDEVVPSSEEPTNDSSHNEDQEQVDSWCTVLTPPPPPPPPIEDAPWATQDISIPPSYPIDMHSSLPTCPTESIALVPPTSRADDLTETPSPVAPIPKDDTDLYVPGVEGANVDFVKRWDEDQIEMDSPLIVEDGTESAGEPIFVDNAHYDKYSKEEVKEKEVTPPDSSLPRETLERKESPTTELSREKQEKGQLELPTIPYDFRVPRKAEPMRRGKPPPRRPPTKPVPFRSIRKAFSKATGIHGFFSSHKPKHPNQVQGQRRDGPTLTIERGNKKKMTNNGTNLKEPSDQLR